MTTSKKCLRMYSAIYTTDTFIYLFIYEVYTLPVPIYSIYFIDVFKK